MDGKKNYLKSIRSTFVKGLFAILPLFLTLYLMIWIIAKTEELLSDWIKALLPSWLYIPGLGILFTFLFILLIGVLVDSFLAQRLIRSAGTWLDRVPFLKVIYRPLKDLMNLFSSKEGRDVKRVVFYEPPGTGLQILGLVTRESFDDIKSLPAQPTSVVIYVPLSYALGGLSMVVQRSHLREVNISVDQAMKLAITAWVKTKPGAGDS